MNPLDDIWNNKTTTKVPDTSSAPIVPASNNPLDNIWNSKITTETKPTFGQSAKGLLSSLVTETGYGASKLVDQVFHLASESVKNYGYPYSEVFGFKDTANKFSERIENFRTKFKETSDRMVEEKRAANPMTNTFASQTIGDIGGMLPTIALAGFKVPATILSLSESFMNVEDSYNENIANGLSKEEATKKAVPQLGADLLGTYITNKLGLLGKFSGGKSLFKSGKSTIGKIVSKVAEHIKDSGLEIGQEVWQQGLSNLATDKPFTENMSETAKRTIIPALFFSTVANISTDKVKKDIEKINLKVENGESLTEDETAIYIVTGGKNPFESEQIAEEVKQKMFTLESDEGTINTKELVDKNLNETESSMDQAKASGQSFDEWVNSRDIVYHGSSADNITNIEKNGFKNVPTTFFAKDEGAAHIFGGGEIKGNNTKTIAVDVTDAKPTIDATGNVVVSAENLKNIKTRSQLKAEWDKVKTESISKAKASGQSFDEWMKRQGEKTDLFSEYTPFKSDPEYAKFYAELKKKYGDYALVNLTAEENTKLVKLSKNNIPAKGTKAPPPVEKFRGTKEDFSTGDELFHATTPDRIDKIATEGLKINTGGREAMSTRGEINPLFFSDSPNHALGFIQDLKNEMLIPENTRGVLLRVRGLPKENLIWDSLGKNNSAMSGGSWSFDKNIPAKYIEIKENGVWKPLLDKTRSQLKAEWDKIK